MAFRVVTDLVSLLYGTGRNVTTDQLFTSIALANELASHDLTILGTIRKNKPEIPKEAQADKNRVLLSSLFCFTKDLMLVSYVPRKNKAVLVLSSSHRQPDISE